MRKFRILFLTHKFYPDIGGIEVNSEILALEFHKAGHDVKMATWTTTTGIMEFPYSIFRSPGIQQLISLHRWADIVFENNPCMRLSWPRILFGTPLVIALCTWVTRIDGQLAWQDKVKQRWLNSASGVIAVSEAVRKKSWPAATVIGNPYRDQLFRKVQDYRAPLSFVFLGRLVSDKGANRAIDAIALLRADSNIPDGATLTIIGDGSEMKNLTDQADRLGIKSAVTFTGVMKGEALIAALNQHRYMLVPSLWEEPFGNVALEGMACGCLPFVSNNGGLPDAVGNAGITFDPHTQNGFIDAIKKIIQNPEGETRYRDAAAEHLNHHRPEKIALLYLELLETAIKNVKVN